MVDYIEKDILRLYFQCLSMYINNTYIKIYRHILYGFKNTSDWILSYNQNKDKINYVSDVHSYSGSPMARLSIK